MLHPALGGGKGGGHLAAEPGVVRRVQGRQDRYGVAVFEDRLRPGAEWVQGDVAEGCGEGAVGVAQDGVDVAVAGDDPYVELWVVVDGVVGA